MTTIRGLTGVGPRNLMAIRINSDPLQISHHTP